MKFTQSFLFALLIGAITFTSCDSDDVKEEVKKKVEQTVTEDLTKLEGTVANYTFTRNGKSTVSFSGQTTRLKQATAIAAAMNKTAATEGQLLQMFKEGKGFSDAELNSSKNLRSKVANSIGLMQKGASTEAADWKTKLDSYLKRQDSEVHPKWYTEATAGNAGFVQVGDKKRYVSGKGLEYDQAFMKTLIGALVVDQVSNHYFNRLDDEFDGSNNYQEANTKGTLAEGKDYTTMEHHYDEAFGYVYGNKDDDKLLLKYINKVSANEDFLGINGKLTAAFGLGRLELAVSKDYAKRDTEITKIRKNIATVVAVRAIYYLKEGKGKLATPKNAFHDLSEGYGFVNSLRFITLDGKTAIFTLEEVEGFISKLEAGNGFWDVTAGTLDEIMNAIAAKFDNITVDKV